MFHPNDKITNTFFKETKRENNPRDQKFIQSVLEEQRRDSMITNVFLQSSAQNPYHEMVDENTKLCNEIKEEKRRRFIEEKRRQQLRQNNQELKDLERKLRGAYISQTLAAQTADREAQKRLEKAIQHYENDVMENARLKQIEYARLKEEDERKKKESLKKDLQKQMELNCVEKKIKYEEFLREKKAIDDIIRKISEEQLEQMRLKLERKFQIQAEMNSFLQEQENWKRQQKQMTDEENIRIEKIIQQREDEKHRADDKKQRIRLEKEKISEQIGLEMYTIEEEKRKRQDLLQDLLIAERKAINDMKYRDSLERQIRDRINVRLELDRHREEHLYRRNVEQKEEERRYRDDLMHQLAERDKLEQLSNEKRRRKIMEHRKSIQESLDEKKRLKAKEMSAILQRRKADISEEQNRQELIEEERIRMLKEHASNLLGFLPPGVLRESDREFLPLLPKQN